MNGLILDLSPVLVAPREEGEKDSNNVNAIEEAPVTRRLNLISERLWAMDEAIGMLRDRIDL